MTAHSTSTSNPQTEESRLRGLHDWAVRHWFQPGRRVHRTTLGYQRRKPDTLPPVEHQRQPLVREGRDIRKLDRNLEQAIVFPNPCHGPSQDAVFRQVYHSGSCRPYCHRLRVYHADKQFHSVSNTSVNETIPKGFRPSGDSRAVMRAPTTAVQSVSTFTARRRGKWC